MACPPALESCPELHRRARDGYVCDADTDLVSATANSKSRQPEIVLPDGFYDVKFPIRAVLEEYDKRELAMEDGRPQDDGAGNSFGEARRIGFVPRCRTIGGIADRHPEA